MDNEVSGALHFSDDEFHRYLDNGASTFDLTVAKKHRIYSNATATDIEMEDFQYLVANNFLIFTYKNKDYKFTIRRVEETETSIRLFCEDLSFDLLNEYRGPYIADKAYNIAKYVNDCLYDSGYTIGINEFAKNTRTLKWEGDDTVLKRLLSICNSFDAELEFETQLNNDRTVNKQLVHLRKRVGLNRPDIELKYGREVSSIRRNVDLTELITAIKPRGHENDGKYVTIKNVVKEVKDSDGNVTYFTKKGSEYLYAPMANQIYGSPEKKSGGYIVGQFSYDTESDTELYNRALTELQLKCMPAYEYEIEGFYDVDIGDTVRAIDEAYNPILMLEARISEQVISFTDPTRNKTVYSNYRVLNNLVSQSLLDRIDDVKDYAEQVARTYIFSLKNVGSSMFKNGIGEVTYTAKAEKNNKDVTNEFDSFNWTKQLKDGTPDEAWNALHVDFGTTLTVTPDDFEDTATFSYVALKGEEVFGGASGVVTKVYDGENGVPGKPGPDGKTTYLHIKYSDDGGQTFTENSGETAGQWLGQYVDFESESSTDVNDYAWSLIKGDTGETGISVSSVTEEYYVSTSDTEQTGGEWSTTVPNNANPNLYVWRRVKNTMSDGTVSYTTPALIQGMTGIYPYIGPTQPANPKEGQQWWKSDSNGNVTDFYAYHDGSWQGQTIQQSVLNIVALNAVNITGSSIVGTTISGSTVNGGVITSDWAGNASDVANSTLPATGTVRITDGNYTNSWTSDDGRVVADFKMLPSGKISMERTATNPSTQAVDKSSYALTSDKLVLKNSSTRSNLAFSGELTAEVLEQLNNCGKTLWTGAYYMQESHTITPSLPITKCLNGWCLVWSRYNPGVGISNSRFYYQFILKNHATDFSGYGITFAIDAPAGATSNTNQLTTKYIYVDATTIKGYAANIVGGGNQYCLRSVIAW